MPLGVQLHDETRLDEMCLIMDELYKYVPDIPVARTFETPASERLTINDYEVCQIPFGGDQLTASRARKSRDLRSNEESQKKAGGPCSCY